MYWRCLFSQDLWVPYMSTGFDRSTFSYSYPATWNYIPASIKNCLSLYRFKHHLKSYLIAQLTNSWPAPFRLLATAWLRLCKNSHTCIILRSRGCGQQTSWVLARICTAVQKILNPMSIAVSVKTLSSINKCSLEIAWLHCVLFIKYLILNTPTNQLENPARWSTFALYKTNPAEKFREFGNRNFMICRIIQAGRSVSRLEWHTVIG